MRFLSLLCLSWSSVAFAAVAPAVDITEQLPTERNEAVDKGTIGGREQIAEADKAQKPSANDVAPALFKACRRSNGKLVVVIEGFSGPETLREFKQCEREAKIQLARRRQIAPRAYNPQPRREQQEEQQSWLLESIEVLIERIDQLVAD